MTASMTPLGLIVPKVRPHSDTIIVVVLLKDGGEFTFGGIQCGLSHSIDSDCGTPSITYDRATQTASTQH